MIRILVLYILLVHLILLHSFQKIYSSHINVNLKHQFSTTPAHNSQEKKFTKIFIGNLPLTATKEDIKNLIDENLGEGLIKDIIIATGKVSKAPRGFAFVDLIDEESAMSAASILNEITYKGRLLNSNVKDDNPSISSRKKTRVHANTVFVSGIDLTLERSEILNMCEDVIGTDLVVSLEMPISQITNKPRGIAYIEFNSVDIALKATQLLNGLEVLGRVLVCVMYKPKKIVHNNLNNQTNDTSADRI
jgi:RNA recognition motif-containing protein